LICIDLSPKFYKLQHSNENFYPGSEETSLCSTPKCCGEATNTNSIVFDLTPPVNGPWIW
jgi:hypothetical protein